MQRVSLSCIEISKNNLVHNYNLFRKYLLPKTKIAVVVKGNAYGHGLNEVVKMLESKVDYWQIDDIEELQRLRAISAKPVLLLGYVSKADLAEIVQLEATLAIYDSTRLYLLNQLARRFHKTAKIHLKVDALLGREGMLLEDVSNFLKQLQQYPNIHLTGIYSHFSNLEDKTYQSHPEKQIRVYHQALSILKKYHYENIAHHFSGSAGILMYHQTQLVQSSNNIVRLGISTYGLWPSECLRRKFANKQFQLKPVLRWVSHVAQVKKLPAKFPVGYGLTYITKRPTTIALIPQGYSDGYDRGLSNCGEVVIHGQICPVLGRISMNMFTVDITHLHNVQLEDEVVLLGKQKGKEITAEDIAARINTINYEIVARISPLLPRVMV